MEFLICVDTCNGGISLHGVAWRRAFGREAQRRGLTLRVYQERHVVCGIAGGEAETRDVWVFGLRVGATRFEVRSAELAGPEDQSLPLALGREDQEWMGLGFSMARRALEFANLGVEEVPLIGSPEGRVAFWARTGDPPGARGRANRAPDSAGEEEDWLLPAEAGGHAPQAGLRVLMVRRGKGGETRGTGHRAGKGDHRRRGGPARTQEAEQVRAFQRQGPCHRLLWDSLLKWIRAAMGPDANMDITAVFLENLEECEDLARTIGDAGTDWDTVEANGEFMLGHFPADDRAEEYLKSMPAGILQRVFAEWSPAYPEGKEFSKYYAHQINEAI